MKSFVREFLSSIPKCRAFRQSAAAARLSSIKELKYVGGLTRQAETDNDYQYDVAC